MSDWVILASFIFVEVWLLLVSLYVIRLRDRVKRDIDHAPLGVMGPPGPTGPMGMRGMDADPTALHELHSSIDQDEGRITALEDRMHGLEGLVWGTKASDETRTLNAARLHSVSIHTGPNAYGETIKVTPKEEPDGPGQPD